MMQKLSQRTHDDCTLCVVAMVMGPPYTYERVMQDSKRYPRAEPTEYRSLTDFCEIFKIEGWRLYSPHFWLARKRIES